MYETRHYAVFSVQELDTIDFSQVLETNKDTVRKSVDETKTFVKWDGETPETIINLQTVDDIYTHEQMIQILATPVWTQSGEI